MMKVYRVKMSYFDGDHVHGYYQSPLFSNRKAAEDFLNDLRKTSDESKQWWSDWGYRTLGPEDAVIEEMSVMDAWDGNLLSAEEYLIITYT